MTGSAGPASLACMVLLLLLTGCAPRNLLEVLAKGIEQVDAPGGAVAVWVGGAFHDAAALGVADLSTGEPVEVDTRFRLGSLTKPFTAMAILRLVDRGELDLEDPIAAFREGVPEGDRITLRHLLTHTSGLPDVLDIEGWWEMADQVWDTDELLDEVFALPLLAEPGEAWNYSNAGYMLLGEVLEARTGLSWDAAIAREVLEPMGLEATSTSLEGIARGYERDEEGVLQDLTEHHHAENITAAGALVSTVRDIACFGDGLMHGLLISDALLEEATTRVVLADGSDWRYGYGLGIDPVDGGWNIGHQGLSPGYVGSWSYRTTRDATIAVLANGTGDGARVIEKLAWEWLDAHGP